MWQRTLCYRIIKEFPSDRYCNESPLIVYTRLKTIEALILRDIKKRETIARAVVQSEIR